MRLVAQLLLQPALGVVRQLLAAAVRHKLPSIQSTPNQWSYRRYQSTISGSFQVVEIIETFVSYMESLERCVW